MKLKTRILDSYFLNQIRKKGIEATQKEVTKFFDETGWRLYDIDSTVKNFTAWRKNLTQKMGMGVE